MSERHAERLYQRLLEGGELSEADRLHVRDCEACRQAVAEVDRLEHRLEAAATTLVTESLPSGILDEPRPAPAARRWQLAIGVAAVAVIATLSIGPVANLMVAEASPTPSASATESAPPITTPSPQPSEPPEALPPGLVAGPDLCGNGAAGFEIRVPDGWYANAGGGIDPACTSLAPEPFGFMVSVDAPVQLVAVSGTFEDAMAVVDRKETPAPESVVLAGYPARRLEYPTVAGATDQQRVYVVSADGAGLEPGARGRYLVAMTTQGATYARDAAALDEAVNSLFFFESMVEDPAIAAAADALMADTDSCQSPDGTYTVSFPASWHTAQDGRCAAFAFGPLPGLSGDYADEMYPDAQITLGISEEAFGSIDPAISLDRFWLAGRPAMRLEWQGGVLSPGPTRSYSYVIGLGRSFDAGPNFIASTSNTGPGDYALNRAVLDRMMGTLSLGQAKADLVRLTDPDLANGGPSVVAFDGSTFVGGHPDDFPPRRKDLVAGWWVVNGVLHKFEGSRGRAKPVCGTPFRLLQMYSANGKSFPVCRICEIATGQGSILQPGGMSARQLAFTAALKPIEPAVDRLSEPGMVAQLAAVLPSAEEQVFAGSASDGRDSDLNRAMYPMRWRGYLAAEHAGAAQLIDNCGPPGALWGWEVGDSTWRAALDALDVAARVAVLDMEGLPVAPGMRAAHRLVLEIAGSGRHVMDHKIT